MTRYRKSIHKALEEVSEWEEAQKPQILIEEEEPIPTETGRELLKKRIAHKKIEKKVQADGDFKLRINNMKNQISGQ
mgnify:CR=1 FL=1